MKRRPSPKQIRRQIRRQKRIEQEELIKDNIVIYKLTMPARK